MEVIRARVGLVGVGLEAYWQQFEGLHQRLCGYVETVAEKLRAMSVDVVNIGLIDTASKGLAAGHRLRREDVDLLVIYATTYALSSSILPMVQRARSRTLAEPPARQRPSTTHPSTRSEIAPA